MKRRIKPLPLVMTVLSALYLVYVVSSESTTLVADAVGGDPGGKVLPLAIAIFLLLGFLYMTITDRGEGEKMEKSTLALFVLTLVLSVSYVLLVKSIGFVLLSTIVLYTLEYMYSTIGEKRRPIPALLGGAGTVALTAGFYTLMRLITKSISRAGRKGSLPSVFTSGTLLAVISLIYVAALTTILILTLVKLLKKRGEDRIANASIITFATVLTLYVVFRQFFLVALAPGLLNF